MSSLYDMFSAFIAMLMSAAFLHFGAAGDSHPTAQIVQTSHSTSVAALDTQSRAKTAPVAIVRSTAHHVAAARHCHGSAGAAPMVDAVRTPSPLRRG